MIWTREWHLMKGLCVSTSKSIIFVLATGQLYQHSHLASSGDSLSRLPIAQCLDLLIMIICCSNKLETKNTCAKFATE